MEAWSIGGPDEEKCKKTLRKPSVIALLSMSFRRCHKTVFRSINFRCFKFGPFLSAIAIKFLIRKLNWFSLTVIFIFIFIFREKSFWLEKISISKYRRLLKIQHFNFQAQIVSWIIINWYLTLVFLHSNG